jgi:pteridine reductase
MLDPMSILTAKKALITGGAKRIGKSIAMKLASDGVDIVVHYNSSLSDAETTADELRATGVQAWLLQADLSKENVSEDVMKEAISLAGGIDILINNASVFTESNLSDLGPDALVDDVQLHALSPVDLARPLVAQEGNRSIVNVLDKRIASACFEHVGYYLSKRMLADITRIMAIEFAPTVRVNGVAPGLILPPPGHDESYMKKRASCNPLKRIGETDEVADAVTFLLNNEFITGLVIYVDGGEHLKGARRD